MATIKLYGKLRKIYGKIHKFHVNSVAEAVRALMANFPTIEEDIKKYNFRIFVDNNNISEDEVYLNTGNKTIKFVPVIAGGKEGWVNIIIGVALIALAVVIAPAGLGALGALGGWAGTIAGTALSLGVGLVLGGVSQMLNPAPKVEGPQTAEKRPSAIFDGPVNTVSQGHPVPVGYGELIIGSAVVSSAIITEEVDLSVMV